jgi:ATP-binding cassette subfamily B protein
MIESLERLWLHLSRRRRLEFFLLLVMVVLTSFAEVLTIGAVLPFLGALAEPEKIFHHQVVQPIVRVLELSEPGQLLFPLTVVFGLAAIFAGAMRLTLLWAQARYSSAIGTDFGISIFRRTLYQPYSVQVSRNSGDVISAISSKTTVVVFQTLFPLLVVFSSFIVLAAIMLVLVYLEPKIALSAIFGFTAIYTVVIALTKKRMLSYGERVNQEQNNVIRALQEGLGGVRDILIDGTQSTFCEIYRRSDFSLRRAQANMLIIGNGPRFVVEAMGMVLITGLAFTFTRQEQGISSVIPFLGALALGAQRVLPAMQQAYSGWTAIRGSQATLSDVLDLLDQPLPEHADKPPSQPIPFSRSITLNNLGFSYIDSGPRVLRDLTLEFPKGSRVGLIGATGSGKSSLLDVIMGLHQPTEGCLSVDGVPVSSGNCRAWQNRIAHVPQSIFLTDASVAENIAFGVPPDRIDMERVRCAAEQAQIALTIESWSARYETLVGERGVRLSGGQRQRIGIARALYKKADVIIFDEATSALDNETERAVMESIESLGKELTVIIVAHRLSTLKNCTVVIELENGRVKRSGPYSEIVGAA